MPIIGNGDILNFEDYTEKRVSKSYDILDKHILLVFLFHRKLPHMYRL